MARTRSKSNAEASVSADSSTLMGTGTALGTSTLMPAATIYEDPALRSSDLTGVSPHIWSGSRAHITRLANMSTLLQLRSRLDTIDEHSRELRNARRILIKREEALVKERDELVELLRSVEISIVASSMSYSNQPNRHNIERADAKMADAENAPDVSEDDLAAEFEPPAKRKASKAVAPSTTKSLAQMPTLIENCPPEFQHSSTPLPRPIEHVAVPRTPQSSPNSKSSVKCNGIRFPPGSAPRPRTRSRASSPFTQMLPPPVPASATASPGTPKPTKVYEPIIGEINMALFESGSQSPERKLPALPLRPMLTPSAHILSPNDDNVAIPAHLFAHKPPVSWEVTYMGPERTPSPPIGESRRTWAPKTRVEDRRRYLEPEPSVPGSKIKVEGQTGLVLDNSSKDTFGPASRTRARVSNVGKGKRLGCN